MASIWKELTIFLFLSAESGEQEPTNRESLNVSGSICRILKSQEIIYLKKLSSTKQSNLTNL